MKNQTSNNLAADSWAIADLLRGDFKQSQYGRIILPFNLLRRLECVLADSKEKVLAEYEKDQEIGIVGYEIPFNRHFYQYQPPRSLADIDADLDAVSAEIMKLLQEVHS